MTAHPKIAAVVLAAVLGLAGCSGHKPCEGSTAYRNSVPGGGLKVPEGLDQPQDSGLMTVPGPGSGPMMPDKCMEAPPRFFAKQGDPNTEGLPVSAVVDSPDPMPQQAGRGPSTRELIPGASVLTNDVAAFVTDWASLWTARNADEWLKCYADDFVQAGYQSHADWEATQRERFQTPASTEVPLDTLQVESIDGNRARAEFVQRFGSAPTFRSVQKELLLERRGRGWAIVEERILDVL